MKKTIFGIIVVVLIIGVVVWYYLSNKKPKVAIGTGAAGKAPKADGTCLGVLVNVNGICSTPPPKCKVGETGSYPNCVAPRMTAIQVQNIIDKSATKDGNGLPTLNYNGTGFDNPNVSMFQQADLQKMLQSGWWFALLTPGSLNGYQAGTNGQYILTFYDLRGGDNSGKSQVAIPANLLAYKVV